MSFCKGNSYPLDLPFVENVECGMSKNEKLPVPKVALGVVAHLSCIFLHISGPYGTVLRHCNSSLWIGLAYFCIFLVLTPRTCSSSLDIIIF